MARRGPLVISVLLIALLLLPAAGIASSGPGPGAGSPRSEPPAPELLSPTNDSWVTEMQLVLCWTYPYGGIPEEKVSFFIQIDNSPSFDTPEVDTGLGQAVYSFSPKTEISNSGSYFWHVGTKDNSTEIFWSETWKFNLDDGAPYVISCHIISDHGYTSNRNVSVSLVARDFSGAEGMRYSFDRSNWSDWAPYAEEFELTLGPADGKWTAYIQVRDRFNHTSNASPVHVVLDTLIPTGTVVINNDSMYATSAGVRLDLAANDTNGIRNMTVSNFADFHDAIWIPYNPTLGWDLSPGEGRHTVYVKFRDPAMLESVVASASIILDVTGPISAFTINSGAAFTNSANVTFQLAAGDPDDIDSFLLSDSESLTGAVWQAFTPTLKYMLPPGDGPKRVHIKVRDLAGNEGPVVNASIILDTAPPATELSELEPSSADLSFPVSWSGTDESSGVRYYDVEYRENIGPWTRWLSQTAVLRAIFSGADGSSYSFRARAVDHAGNTGPFAEPSENRVRIDVPLPFVDIQWPLPGTTIHDTFTATGSASHPAACKMVETVEVRIDNGTWVLAEGQSSWSFQLDPSKLENGRHIMEVRSFDGTKYSETVPRVFYVEDRSPGGTVEPEPPYLILATALLLGLVAGMLVLRKWRKR